jgi:anti-anti-sigma factor
MQTQLHSQEGNCRVAISGRITIDSSPDLLTLLLQRLESPACESLILDLYDVLYVDTSCLAVLLETLRKAHAQKKPLYLTGLRDRLRDLLEETRTLRMFNEVARDLPQ